MQRNLGAPEYNLTEHSKDIQPIHGKIGKYLHIEIWNKLKGWNGEKLN